MNEITEKEIKIIIADDHQLVRRGLRQTIEAEANFTVIAEASDGQAALRLITELLPDVAVLDVDMPKMDGLEVARSVAAKNLPVEIIFLTIHSEEVLFHHALDLGARGYVLKDSAADDIVTAVKTVVAGRYFTSLSMTSYLLAREATGNSLEKPPRNFVDKLTPTELRVLKMLADYQTSKEIAQALGVSPRTVEAHRANMCQKLDLQGSHALAKFAVRHRGQF
jgi:DNA-binding NarL/FixJ family response regulator